MRRLAIILPFTAFLVAGIVSVGAQQSKQIFAAVLDVAGGPIMGLGADAFTVFEDGVASKTLKVEPIEWPIKLTVMVDNGGKSSDYLASLRRGLQLFFKAVPREIETSILTLAPQPRWVVRPTMDGQQLEKGITLITPDGGAAKFFDGLAEAADRAAKEKGNFFPVFVMVVSTLGGTEVPLDFQVQKLQKQLAARGATVHFVLLTVNSETRGTVTGAVQTNLGLAMTQFTGGRYEGINSASRLESLLGEIGEQITLSALRQAYQYRITYEAPKGAKEPKSLGVEVKSLPNVTVQASLDGHLP
jgi:hypothetical protein